MLSENHNHTPIILFFSSQISPSSIRDYKNKCLLFDQAVHDKLSITLKALNKKGVSLNAFGVDDGRFFGFRKVKGKLIKMFLNINKVKEACLVNGVLKITYNVLL